MKYLLIISLFFMKTIQGMSQEIISIKLTEQTRGFQREIVVSEKNINKTENANLKKKSNSIKQWNTVLGLCKNIALEKLSTYVPPSSKRASDGALHTILEIKTKDKIYQSQTFDNDNPPQELKALIGALAKF